MTNRQFSDEQLGHLTFRIRDPLEVEQLCHDRPDPSLEPQIVGEYDVTPEGGRAKYPDGPWIWCAHCQKETHWRGFVITNETRYRYLIGSTCGPLHYGLGFVGVERQFREFESRKRALDRLAAMATAAPKVTEVVDQILHSGALRPLELKRAELKAVCPAAFHDLSSALHAGTPLHESVRIRDYQAEQQRADMLGDRAPAAPMYRFERVSLGRVDGGELVRERGDCREALVELKSVFARVFEVRRNTNAETTRTLVSVARRASETFQRAQESIDEVRRAPLFFSEANKLRLERWSAENRYYTIMGDPAGLRLGLASTRGKVIKPLELIEVPDLPALSSVT